jgi:GTPase SAR1 family protein
MTHAPLDEIQLTAAFLGPSFAGKTTLVRALVDGSPPASVFPSVTSDYYCKCLQANALVVLKLWDVVPEDSLFLQTQGPSLQLAVLCLPPQQELLDTLEQVLDHYDRRLAPLRLKKLLVLTKRAGLDRADEAVSACAQARGYAVLKVDSGSQAEVDKMARWVLALGLEMPLEGECCWCDNII